MSAVEKSVALLEETVGAMDLHCPVCRGGWWYDQGELTYAVHVTECSWADRSESEISAIFQASQEREAAEADAALNEQEQKQ